LAEKGRAFFAARLAPGNCGGGRFLSRVSEMKPEIRRTAPQREPQSPL
jgi:hypothetical protein